MQSPAYFKFFAVVFLLVSGFLVATAFPPTRRRMSYTNGQQLYLVSAVAGILVSFIPGFLYLVYANLTDQIDSESSWFSFLFSDDHALPYISLLTLFLAFFLWCASFLIGWYWAINMDHPDRIEKIAGFLKVRKLSDPFRDIVKSAYGYSLYLSYKYLSYSARKSIGNDGQNCMFYENMQKYMSSSDENSSDDNENLLMITTDSKKVFIGSVFRMPEQNLFEQDGTLGIVPFMSGYLCDSCLQLHITTDYTKILEDINTGKIKTDKSMIAFLPVKNIYYTRDFDVNIFSNNFRRKVCACGDYVDNTQGFKPGKYSPLIGRSKKVPDRDI